jgi:hypothetical protein
MGVGFVAKIWDALERAGWTAGQQFVAVLLTASSAGSALDLPWQLALSMSAGAAVISIVGTVIQYLTGLTGLSFWPDLLVRVVKTFVASMLGAFGAEAFNVLDFDWSGAFDLAVVATLVALAKGLLARGPRGAEPQTPSTLRHDTYRLATGPA